MRDDSICGARLRSALLPAQGHWPPPPLQADMVVEFNTAYYCDSTRAHVETNRFKIAWRYITTWFIFDLVAVLPGGV